MHPKKRLSPDFFKQNNLSYDDVLFEKSVFKKSDYYKTKDIFQTSWYRETYNKDDLEYPKILSGGGVADYFLYTLLTFSAAESEGALLHIFRNDIALKTEQVLMRQRDTKEILFSGSLTEFVFDILRQTLLAPDDHDGYHTSPDNKGAFLDWAAKTTPEERVGAFFLDTAKDLAVNHLVQENKASCSVYRGMTLTLLWERTRALALNHPLFHDHLKALRDERPFFALERYSLVRHLGLSDAKSHEKHRIMKTIVDVWGEERATESLIARSLVEEMVKRGLSKSYIAMLDAAGHKIQDFFGERLERLPGVYRNSSARVDENLRVLFETSGVTPNITTEQVVRYFQSHFQGDYKNIYDTPVDQWTFYQKAGVVSKDLNLDDFIRIISKPAGERRIIHMSQNDIENLLKNTKERDFLLEQLSGHTAQPTSAKRKI